MRGNGIRKAMMYSALFVLIMFVWDYLAGRAIGEFFLIKYGILFVIVFIVYLIFDYFSKNRSK